MSWRDRFTDAVGGAIAGAADLVSNTLEKAQTQSAILNRGTGSPVPLEAAPSEPKSLLVDPFALIDQLGFRERPTGLTYRTLDEMAKRVPTVAAIIQTRATQVSAFAQRQKDKREPGFRVVLRDHKKSATKEDERKCAEFEDWIIRTGSTPDASLVRDDFRTFLRKLVRDTLIYDQAAFEVVPNRKGIPSEFYAVDAATIRLADMASIGSDYNNPDMSRFVEVYDEMVINEYSARELCFGIRNPRTDIRANGYGFSELEMLIHTITATLWAFEYNKKHFSQGSMVHGLLNFKGSIPDSKLDAFRRQWKMMIQGVSNSHRTPMTNVEDIQWIDFGRNNRDMEFSAWMDWLIKITCGVYQFDPAEINFSYGNSGQQSQVFATPVESKLKMSKDRGLRPLLKDIAGWINRHLIWQIDPNFEFGFFGLDEKTTDQAVELAKKQSTYLKTVDELRAEEDLPPLPDGKGDVILDQTWMTHSQIQDMGSAQAFLTAGKGGQENEDQQDPGKYKKPSMQDTSNQRNKQQGEEEEEPQIYIGPNGGKYMDPAHKIPYKHKLTEKSLEGGHKAVVRVYEIDL